MEGVLVLLLSMSFILMITDRWQTSPLPLIFRFVVISGVALLSFSTLISQSKSYWFKELISEKWIIPFSLLLLLEMTLGVLFSRYSSNSIVQKLKEITSFLPRPTFIGAVLLIEILVFDLVHGWSFQVVSIVYSISIFSIGLIAYFLFRKNVALIKLKSIIVTVFSILQLLLISTLLNPQDLEKSSTTTFDMQTSAIVGLFFFAFVIIGYLISIRKKYGLRK